MKPRRVLVLMHKELVPPESVEGYSEKEAAQWKTEFDVVDGLKKVGHEARPLGVDDELGIIRDAILDFQPHIIFNLLEEFRGLGAFVPFILGYLQLLQQPFTGCNPRGLLLTENKTLVKKILKHHRIPVPDFAVFPLGRRIQRPARLKFPLIVKSPTIHGSVGISQASLVTDDEKMRQRIEFIHEQFQTDAVAEQYVEGREIYVGVIGNRRLQTLPIWEMKFDNLPDGAPHIATSKIKWDPEYREKNVVLGVAEDLPDPIAQRIRSVCKRAYRVLEQSGYARMDLRVTPEGKVHFIECNSNPELACGGEFADSAEAAGIKYGQLLQRIITLAFSYRPEQVY